MARLKYRVTVEFEADPAHPEEIVERMAILETAGKVAKVNASATKPGKE